MSVPEYNINLEDERFQQVETDKHSAITDVNNTYDEMMNNAGGFYDAQIQASKDWVEQQSQAQQDRTDFTIETIEQQKEQAEKEYKKEQKGAYTDWKKQSNQYGVNAETIAASGLTGTGYSESSQVGMYNTYQNRVAAARESHATAILNYNNLINEAKLQNDSALAEIATQGYIQQTEIALQGFQYENSLILEKQNQLQATEDRYYSRWQDVYNQIYQENAFNESVRQYEQNYAYQQEQDRIAQEQWKQQYELQQSQLAEEQRQYDAELAEKQRQYDLDLKEQQRQFDEALKNSSYQFGDGEKEETAGVPYADEQPETSAGFQTVDQRLGVSNTKASGQYSGNVTGSKYWSGEYNSDCNEFGTFDNGYQPKGISGYGEVSKTGEKITFVQTDLDGKKKEVTQNIWKTEDGSLWYWLGSQNKYVPYEEEEPKYKAAPLKSGAGSKVSYSNLLK